MDRTLFTILPTMLMLVFTTSASAISIKIHVHDADNAKPLKNVAVCLGTTGNTNQFGATRTDARGNVTFTDWLPGTPVLLTVSGEQHKGLQRVLPAGLSTSNTDLVRTIDLPRGGLGPVCDAPPAKIAGTSSTNGSTKSSLKITSLNLDRGNSTTHSRSIVLSSGIRGNPTHYRISEDPEFKDSEWLQFQKTPLFTLSQRNGRKRVFYQVKRAVEMEAGSIYTTSNIVSDRITLRTE